MKNNDFIVLPFEKKIETLIMRNHYQSKFCKIINNMLTTLSLLCALILFYSNNFVDLKIINGLHILHIRVLTFLYVFVIMSYCVFLCNYIYYLITYKFNIIGEKNINSIKLKQKHFGINFYYYFFIMVYFAISGIFVVMLMDVNNIDVWSGVKKFLHNIIILLVNVLLFFLHTWYKSIIEEIRVLIKT